LDLKFLESITHGKFNLRKSAQAIINNVAIRGGGTPDRSIVLEEQQL